MSFVSRREKRGFLSEQCKEIKENNRMGKTRDLSKKVRDTNGMVLTKIGTIKDRNSMDLTEIEDIKMRWQEYTEELYKKDLHDPDNQVKWALGSITMNKSSGGDEIPAELFQILKDEAVKVPANLENSAVATGLLEKVSFHSSPQEEQCHRMVKLPHNCNPFTCWQSDAQNPSI